MVNAEGNSGFVLPANWATLTPEQKRQWRLNSYLDPSNIKFVSDGAKKSYQTRARRTVDVYNLREPDGVPVILQIGQLPYTLNWVSVRTAMYDYVQAAPPIPGWRICRP